MTSAPEFASLWAPSPMDRARDQILFVSRDGEPVSAGQATLSLFDPAVLYGQAAFETFRGYGGRTPGLDLHLDRLAASARAAGLRWPHPGSSRAAVEEAVAAASAGEGPGNPSARVLRVVVVPGAPAPGETRRPPFPSTFDHPRVWVWAQAGPPPPDPGRPEPLAAVLQADRHHPVPAAKLTSYMGAWASLRAAAEEGADDAIWHREGRVTEGPTANVLAWIEGAWWAPDPRDRALDGVTRRLLLDALATRDIPVQVRPLPVERLQQAEEIVLTSSVREVASVVTLDGRPVGSGRVGPRARQAHRLYRAQWTEAIRAP
ncbi:MAG TPA: aminotransferase class IV [Myxococcales bacterium LLY-WYZ-16_1]|nr:aminotransferase class IV [Myxococcales bacterium LLY-WYZ-16_1]